MDSLLENTKFISKYTWPLLWTLLISRKFKRDTVSSIGSIVLFGSALKSSILHK